MKINTQSNINFGYSKSLNNKLNKKLDKDPHSQLYDSIRSFNESCNKIEDTIIKLEGRNQKGLDENEDVINFHLDFLFAIKPSLCVAIDKIFPELNFTKKSIDSYDKESIKITDFREEKYSDVIIDEEGDKRVWQWRELMIDELLTAKEDNTQRVETQKTFQKKLQTNSKEKNLALQPEDEKTVQKFIPVEDSPKSLDDIIGLNDCKEDIEDLIITPLKNFSQAQQQKKDYGIEIPSFILFHGAPGCGKTMLAQAIATQTGCDMYTMDISTIGSAYVNESSQNIAKAFEYIEQKAKKSKKPVILFMDEMDSLLSKRSNSIGGSKEDNKIVNTLLPLIVGAKDKNIIIIGATNAYDFLDPAAKSRVNFEAYIGLPQEKEIKELLKVFLNKVSKGKTLAQNEEELEELSKELKKYSPRTIKEIFKKAGRIASRKQSEITKEDFKKAIQEGSWEKIKEEEYMPENKKTKKKMGFIPS